MTVAEEVGVLTMSAVETLRCQGRPSSLDPQKQSVHNLLPLSPEPNNPGTGEPDPHLVRFFRGTLCGALLHSLLLLEARTFCMWCGASFLISSWFERSIGWVYKASVFHGCLQVQPQMHSPSPQKRPRCYIARPTWFSA